MIKLSKIDTRAPKGMSKEKHKVKTIDLVARLGELQNLMFAESKHSLLVVIQGMDASGKDGLIRNVFHEVNPMGVKVQAFKKPTDLEMAHDFLWRVHAHAPEKGVIQVFNRSHYEDVLIQRVHKWIDMDTVKRRFDHINAFEKLMQEHGTTVLKFYLHISQEEQLARLKERMEIPEKRWKYNKLDFDESELWPQYMKAYEDVLNHCSPSIPWHIIPSDQNWCKEYMVVKKLVDTLESFKMKFPEAKSFD